VTLAAPDAPAAGRVATAAPRRLAATAVSVAVNAVPWYRYRRRRPLTIVVLGMHRSGTSAIARMLNLCGASLPRDLIQANRWNTAGYWEPAESVSTNDAILELSGGAWDRPPPSLRVDLRFRWRMKGFLDRLHPDGVAVWKDPRAVLTFPLWKPLLCRYLLVAVFRHPLSVAQSLRRRQPDLSVDRGLALWRGYNERLLALAAAEREAVWIDFDAGLDHVLARVQAVARSSGLVYREAARESYAAGLRTSDAADPRLDDSLRALYARLRAVAHEPAARSST
jgi:hypothetical protein